MRGALDPGQFSLSKRKIFRSTETQPTDSQKSPEILADASVSGYTHKGLGHFTVVLLFGR